MDHKKQDRPKGTRTPPSLVPSLTPGGSVRYLLRTGEIVMTRSEGLRELRSAGYEPTDLWLVVVREAKIEEVIHGGREIPTWVMDLVDGGLDPLQRILRSLKKGQTPTLPIAYEIPSGHVVPKKTDVVANALRIARELKKSHQS